MSNVSKAIPTSIIALIAILVSLQGTLNSVITLETPLSFDFTPLYVLAGVGLPMSALYGIQKLRVK